MNRPVRRILAAMALGWALTAGCAAPSRTVAPPFTAAVDSAVTAAMTATKVPGALVGIWSPDGSYTKAFGVADTGTGRSMDTGFFSRIGSVTKTFTATAVLQLAGAGRVGLDDPIARYLDGVPGGQAITVRQLATMRSGLADYTETEAFQSAVSADPRRTFAPQDLLRWAYTEPARFPPGAEFEYSNTNYILLGLLVEKVAAAPLAEYFADHIFSPLGMLHSSFPTGTEFPSPHASGYADPVDGVGGPVDASGWSASMTWAAGAAISTLDDMRTWVPALATGKLLEPQIQLQRLQTEPQPGRDFAYGFGIFTVAGWVGHNGSVPGYQTVAMYLPQRRMTLVLMLNTDIAAPAGGDPSEAIAKAVTSVISPDHVYAL